MTSLHRCVNNPCNPCYSISLFFFRLVRSCPEKLWSGCFLGCAWPSSSSLALGSVLARPGGAETSVRVLKTVKKEGWAEKIVTKYQLGAKLWRISTVCKTKKMSRGRGEQTKLWQNIKLVQNQKPNCDKDKICAKPKTKLWQMSTVCQTKKLPRRRIEKTKLWQI